MAKVVGVGGVFLQFKGDDQELRDWYESHLQLEMTPFGVNFISGDQLTLVAFTKDSETRPSINFRVDNLRELIQLLETDQCRIVEPIKKYPYGLFAQIEDPFGNLVELWEPNKDEYKKMVNKEQSEYIKRKSTNE